jgi:putative transposase
MSRIFWSAQSRRLRLKKSRNAETQILAILRQATGGEPVAELCREHGMTRLPGRALRSNRREGARPCYKWRAKYGGMPSRAFATQNPVG